MSELRPCPFCGSPAQQDAHYMIECPECSAAITGSENLPQRWNRRTPGPTTKAMLDRIREIRNRSGDSTVISVAMAANLVSDFLTEWKNADG